MISHQVGEAFFQPQIVEPAHRHQIAEPLMSQFVQHQRSSAVFVALRWSRSEQDRIFPQESGSGVLHPAVSKAGNQNLIVFGERKFVAEEINKMLYSRARQPLDFRPFFLGTFKLRLANEKSHRR